MKKLSRRELLALGFVGLSASFIGGIKIMSKNDIRQMRMPTLFFGHGSPMNAIEENDFTKTLSNLGKTLPVPNAILMISAHWMTKGTLITGMDKPKTIHDFYGFPEALFSVQYPASGSPEKVKEVVNTISDPDINLDLDKWGLDHGTWSVLKHLYPQANIPVFQLSLDMTKPMLFHFELGQKLKFLRDQGVMIIGSGNIVHNLRQIRWGSSASAYDWAIDFDEWVKGKALDRDFKSLIDDPLKTQAGKLSVPTLDHYLPLLYILGASDEKDQLHFDYEGFQNSSMSMRSFRFS